MVPPVGASTEPNLVCTQHQSTCSSAVQIANLNDHLSDPAAINGFNAATKFVVSGASLCCSASWYLLAFPPLAVLTQLVLTTLSYASCSQESKRRDFPSLPNFEHLTSIIDAAFASMRTWPTVIQITVKHFEQAVVELAVQLSCGGQTFVMACTNNAQ